MPRTQWDWVSRYKISLPSLSEQRQHSPHPRNRSTTKSNLIGRWTRRLRRQQGQFSSRGLWISIPCGQRWRGGSLLAWMPKPPLYSRQIFKNAPLGKIPEGWRRRNTQREIAQNVRRSANVNQIDSNDVYIGLEHMPKRSIALSEWQTADGIGSNKSRFRKGEILFGKLRPYFHKVGVAPTDGVCSTDILVVQPIKSEWFDVVLGIVSCDEFVAYTDAHSTGTRMPRTNWRDMSKYEFVLPQLEIAQKYSDLIRPLIGRIIENIHQSHTLSQIREALLPKLLSGEVHVSTAQRRSYCMTCKLRSVYIQYWHWEY